MSAAALNILIRQLRVDEGLRLRAYLCSKGKWTIGFGRNLTARGFTPEQAQAIEINTATAEAWLAEDAGEAMTLAARLPCFDKLNDARKAVIANMVFNMGPIKVRKFREMWKASAMGDYRTAAREMLDSDWHKDVGERARRLARMMETGVA